MGNRSAADADGLLAGRALGTGIGAGGPGATAALVGGVLLIGAVLAGNSLVCMSVAAERALQTPTNYFIVSLAAADLLLALLVLPLFVYSEVSPRRPRTRTLTRSGPPARPHGGPSPTPPLGFSGSWSWALCGSQDDRSRVPAEPRSLPPSRCPSVRSAVRPPSHSVPLSAWPSLLPKICFCPSSTDPSNRRLWQSSPPPSPLRWVPAPRGSQLDRLAEAGLPHTGSPGAETQRSPHEATATQNHTCSHMSTTRARPSLLHRALTTGGPLASGRCRAVSLAGGRGPHPPGREGPLPEPGSQNRHTQVRSGPRVGPPWCQPCSLCSLGREKLLRLSWGRSVPGCGGRGGMVF